MNKIVNQAIIPHKPKDSNKKLRKWILPTLLVVLCALSIPVCIILIKDTIRIGASSLQDNYITYYSSEKKETYQKIYDAFFTKAEEEYHVSNKVSISIGEIKELNKLEVLRVSDVEYIIEDKQDNASNIISWLEVPGEGVFVVDLAAGEYIVDNEREFIHVRIPYPELANIMIDYENVEKILFKNDIFDDSYSIGEELAEQQLNKANMLIKKEFISNQYFYSTAQDAARSTIINLVKQMNPNVPNIKVEVEFY